MNFSNLKTKDWSKNYQNWLPFTEWVVGILVVFILAKLFWLWFLYFFSTNLTTTSINSIRPLQTTQDRSTNKTNIQPLLAMNLFGSIAVDEPEETVTEAPETRLDLKLRGIYSAENPEKANAIIENGRGRQAVYFIDEQLEDVMGRVFLREVYYDKVIIETNGKKETLKLDENELLAELVNKDSSRPIASNLNKRIEDKRNNAELNEKLGNYREQFLDDPKSIMDIVKGRPHFVEGELRGFMVSPGKDRRLFKELGLKRGDIITAVNGIAFTSMQDAMQLMNEAQSIENMDVEIQRGDETVSLLLSL